MRRITSDDRVQLLLALTIGQTYIKRVTKLLNHGKYPEDSRAANEHLSIIESAIKVLTMEQKDEEQV